jgi:hypothetical protein
MTDDEQITFRIVTEKRQRAQGLRDVAASLDDEAIEQASRGGILDRFARPDCAACNGTGLVTNPKLTFGGRICTCVERGG